MMKKTLFIRRCPQCGGLHQTATKSAQAKCEKCIRLNKLKNELKK